MGLVGIVLNESLPDVEGSLIVRYQSELGK
jgi:hypothetical protein